MRADYTFDLDPKQYTEQDHAMWKKLCDRQKPLLKNRACREYLESIEKLGIVTGSDRIPDWRRISDILEKTSNFKLVTVPGYIPPVQFLGHLAKRQFPVTWWIREPAKMDYLMEPDIFHDLFGHVPMLALPVYADYMEQWGLGALKANKLDADKMIERLYWFTVEFGLINTEDGLRIYGSGIVSSSKESVYCLESPVPNRLKFDLERIMISDYRIDDVQKTYFVIDSFEQLFEETKPDFTSIYDRLRSKPLIADGALAKGDQIITRGTIADKVA
jgi:phenylalanine-4-hydroxylase